MDGVWIDGTSLVRWQVAHEESAEILVTQSFSIASYAFEDLASLKKVISTQILPFLLNDALLLAQVDENLEQFEHHQAFVVALASSVF